MSQPITPGYYQSGSIVPVTEFVAVDGGWVPMAASLIGAAAPPPTGPTNAALNPSLDTNLGGWANHDTSGFSVLSRDTVSPISSPGSACITTTAAGFSFICNLTLTGGSTSPVSESNWSDPAYQAVAMIPGKVTVWSLDVKSTRSPIYIETGLWPIDAIGDTVDDPAVGFNGVQETGFVTTAANQVIRVGCTCYIPPGSTAAIFTILVQDGNPPAGTKVWFDNLFIEVDSGRTYVPPDVFGYHPKGTY